MEWSDYFRECKEKERQKKMCLDHERDGERKPEREE